ncbi:hypothetical protein RclHR1_09830012 [Rhizophagus clarus]|uniref:Endonuclease/exonuclease/phosphatase domain-containing protein n=1 Tax=Rhizophagus clarus TaxID=94130 RepID=A0A2Z6SBI3_9GLOM|nr:hypothetical protein RclHR1_09830012 [Rhizophagus clarus]
MEPSDQGQNLNILVPQDNNTTSFISPSLNRELDIFLRREKIICNNNNLECTDHNINFIDFKIGFHNINRLALNPRKLAVLLEWCHDNSFDFMGIAETNSNILNLQHYINDTNADSSYEIQGFLKMYYLPSTDQHTLQSFKQIMNNTTSDLHIIHIWMGDTNRHFDHSLDVHPSTSDKKEDIPLCFHHLNLIDSFRFLNPEAKEFSWHQRSQDEALRIDTHIDHIWVQRHITPSLRSAHHYEEHTLTESDHDIVTVNLYLPEIFPIAYKHTQLITPHDSNFRELLIKTEDITADHWALFEAQISDSAHSFDQLINTLNTLHNILDPSDLTNYSQGAMEIVDKCWVDIKEILMSAAAHTLSLRKRTTLHPKLKPKDKPFDMKNLKKYTTKLSVFIFEICQYQATTPHDPAAFFRLKDKWDSQILLFNKDYADDRELQFDISFFPDSTD